MFTVIGAIKSAAGTVADRVNGLAHFVVVPEAPSKALLEQLGISAEGIECHFCHDSLTDLRQLRAVYNYQGKYVATCDKFECAIEARDRLIE